MIENDNQYRISVVELEKFRRQLVNPPDGQDWKVEVENQAIRSIIDSLESEITDYLEQQEEKA